MRLQNGQTTDFQLTGLENFYEDVSKVNRAMLQRINDMPQKDAGKNAIYVLETFGALLTMELDTNLRKFKNYFSNNQLPSN